MLITIKSLPFAYKNGSKYGATSRQQKLPSYQLWQRNCAMDGKLSSIWLWMQLPLSYGLNSVKND